MKNRIHIALLCILACLTGQAQAGGYTVNGPVSTQYIASTNTGYNTSTNVPFFMQVLNDYYAGRNSTTMTSGGCGVYITCSGDPVNMVTGNMYHTERDISIKGRGGLPIVFERSYNSRQPVDGPLGYGWAHSFNHSLKFYGVEGGVAKVSWIDGTGAEKFFATASHTSGNIAVGVIPSPAGVFVTFQRQPDGSYTLREKNGLTYQFETATGPSGVPGTATPVIARLLSITDRNSNALNLSYTATANCTGGTLLCSVSDALSRTLSFTYTANRITQIQDFSGRQYQYGYDANGNLNSFKNPLSVANSTTQPPVTYSYYTTADGASLNHLMKQYTLPRNNGMKFEYYTNGRVFRHTVVNIGGSLSTDQVNTFTYNDFRRETVQVSERGYVRSFFFDPNGNPLKIVEENGAEHSYEYTQPGQPFNRTAKTGPQGLRTQYAYDANGNVTGITAPSGAITQFFDFTAYNQPRRIQDARGNWSILRYDANGNLTDSIRTVSAYTPATCSGECPLPAAAQILSWSVNGYDNKGNLVSSKQVKDFAAQIANNTPTSNTGPILAYGYDTNQLNATTVARTGIKNSDASATTQSATLAYDSLGRLTTGIDAGWYATKLNYDAVDRIIQATDPLGNLRDYAYDANGNPVGQKLNLTINGVATLIDSSTASYDSSDRKQLSLDTAGNATAYQYDAAGNIIKITNPDNYSLAFDYDAGNHVIKAYDQENHAVSRTLDLSGKPRSITDSNNNTVKYDYYGATRDGRLQKTTDALLRTTSFDYDLNGNTISVTDNAARTTLTTYDELDRPGRIVGPQYTDATYGPIRPVTQYVYDTLGNLTQVSAGRTDSSGTNPAADVTTPQTTAAFDDFGRKTKETDPLGKFWTFAYDPNNNLSRATDAKNQTTQYVWGYGHQLLSRTDASGNVTGYARNALGQVLVAQTPSVTTRYGYDAAHRLASINDSRGNKTLSYTYSPGGLLNKMLDSDNNETDYLYDPIGRLTGIWAPNTDYVSFSYDAGGRLVEKWFPNGADTQYTWNPDNTLASLTNKMSGSVISQHDYTYDTAGNRATHTEKIGATTTPYKYVYDELDRLTEVRNNSTSALIESTTYDVLNNRTAKSDGVNTTAYVFDAANQLKEIRQTSASGALLAGLVYDANGSVISKCESGTVTRSDTACTGTTTTNLTYDALNRVSQVAKTGLSTQAYTYDDQDRRIGKTVGAATTNFLYSGPDIVAEYASWTSPAAQYTHGPNTDDPLIRATATAALYYHADGLGSIVAVTDSNGPRSNVALAANGGVASASSTYSASYPAQAANDGDRKGLNWGAGGGWNDATNAIWPDWLQIDFAAARTINEIDVFTQQDNSGTAEPTPAMTFTQNGITAFDVQYWNGSAWVTLASVTGNNLVWRKFTFSPVTTSKIRVVVYGGANTVYAYSRIVEVEAYTVDNTGTQRFDAWGNQLQATGSIPQYGFTGREPDETGLTFYRARFYDPTIGRFVSRDPIGLAGGINQYAYVGDNPVNFTDPSGKWAYVDDAIFTVGGAVLGLAGQGAVDLARGKLSSFRDYLGAGVGGAAAGEAALYTGPVGAGAAGGLAAATAKNTYDLATGNWSAKGLVQRAVDTVVDVGSGMLGGKILGAAIPGISAGRNSYSAIADQMITKFENGTISTVSTNTAGKMFAGKAVKDAWFEAATLSAGIGAVYDKAKDAMSEETSGQSLRSMVNPAPSAAPYSGSASAGVWSKSFFK